MMNVVTTTRRGAARRRAARVASAGIVGAALVLGGCGTDSGSEPQAAAPTGQAPEQQTDGGGPDSAATSSDNAANRQEERGPALNEIPVRSATDGAAPPPPAPTRVTVGELDIELPVVPTGTAPDGTMELPDSADEGGWYRFGPAPGSDEGATVIAAHIDDSDSVGPFASLPGAREGTTLTVSTADGTAHNYTVTEVRSVEKSQAPLAEIFDRSGAPRLVLVTCGGRWDADAQSYEDNVVVTATPTS